MAITTIKKYTFNPIQAKGLKLHFELKEISLNTHCSAIKSEVSDYYRIYWVEDGSGTYDIDFTTFEINGSGIFCVSPEQVFMVKNEKVKQAFEISFDKEFYCVETHGKEIACNGLLFNNVHRSSAVTVLEKDKGIFSTIINNIILEFKNKGDAHKDMLETYLRMFMIQTLRLLDNEEKAQGDATHQKNKVVMDFIALVGKHFRTTHSVSVYAEKLFISPKSLTKKLKTLGYPTPTKIIRERLIVEAKRDLAFSNDNVKEIAYSLGFEDPGYFTRLFAKEVGMTPLEYRKDKSGLS